MHNLSCKLFTKTASYSVVCHVRCKFTSGSSPMGGERFTDESKGKTMFLHESHRAVVPCISIAKRGSNGIIVCPAEAITSSKFPSKVNKLNSTLPNKTNKTSALSCKAIKLNSNSPSEAG